LLSQLLLLSTRPPYRRWIVIRILVHTAHPLETAEFLVGVDLVVVFVFVVFLIFFFLLAVLGSSALSTRAPLSRLFTLLHLFAALGRACVLLAKFLGGAMAANVRHSLHFLLLGELFSFLLFLLQLETFRCCLELGLVDNEKVTGAPLTEIRLRQDVLHTSDGTNFTFLIDVFQLVHFIRLINDPITLLEVDQLVRLLAVENLAQLPIVPSSTLLLCVLRRCCRSGSCSVLFHDSATRAGLILITVCSASVTD